jgi:leader peptidase (prepilin peptidase)/N-methyltransferase
MIAAIPPAALGLGAAVGAVLGSFVSTLAIRAATGRSALVGRSACDDCGVNLRFGETAPIWSYVRLRGACAACGARIDPAHPLGEIAGAVSGAVVVLLAPPQTWAPLVATGAALLFAATFDARRLRIPDAVSLIVAGAGLLVAVSEDRWLEAAMTGLAVGLLLIGGRAAFRRARGRTGLGLGDVKLLAALAVWTGPTLAPLGVALAASLAFAWAYREGRLSPLPLAFGPFIAAAFWPLVLGRTSA